MIRAERKEFNYIKHSLKKNITNPYGAQLTIRTDAGHEYKQALHELYTDLGFHPASVCVNTRWFDEKERIVYIYGIRCGENNEYHWTELYTKEEKERFAAALL